MGADLRVVSTYAVFFCEEEGCALLYLVLFFNLAHCLLWPLLVLLQWFCNQVRNMYRNIEDGTEIPEYGTLIRSRKVTIAAVIAAIVALTVLLSASSPAPIVGQAMEASQLDMSIEHDKVVKESDVGLDHPIHMDGKSRKFSRHRH